MLLWIILTAMACAAAVLIAIPLVRRYEDRTGRADADTLVYRDQLNVIERDRAAGDIGDDQYQLARLEIQRRILASAKAASTARPVPYVWKMTALAASIAFVALASVNLYALYGNPGAAGGEAAVSAMQRLAVMTPQAAGAAGNVDDKIGQLAARLEKQPGDTEGWRMLGWSYFNTGRYGEAAAAYAKAMALAPDDISYKSSYAEALVQAAGGVVTPEARKVFEAVLAADPKEERSRFYQALASEQAGRSAEALDLWQALLADAPRDAGWLEDVRSHIAALGKATGRDVSAALASTPAAPVVTEADVTTISSMAAGDQQAMITGMVERLAKKLEASPHDAEGWKRLIRSRAVLNQPDLAKQALGKALAEFAGDTAVRQDIASLGRELGVMSE